MQQHPSSRPARSSSSCKGQSLETCTSLNPNDYTYASLQQLAMPQLCAQFMMCSMLARWLPQPPMQFAAPHQPFQMPCAAANCAPPLHLVPFAPPEVHAPAQHLSKSMAAPVSALPSPRGKRTSDCSRQIAAPAKARKTATAKEVAAAPRPHDANTPLALEPLALKDIRDLFEEHERPQETIAQQQQQLATSVQDLGAHSAFPAGDSKPGSAKEGIDTAAVAATGSDSSAGAAQPGTKGQRQSNRIRARRTTTATANNLAAAVAAVTALPCIPMPDKGAVVGSAPAGSLLHTFPLLGTSVPDFDQLAAASLSDGSVLGLDDMEAFNDLLSASSDSWHTDTSLLPISCLDF